MKHRNSLSSINDLVGSNLSSPVRLYGSPTRKKQVIPYSPRSPNKTTSLFSIPGKASQANSLNLKTNNIHFSPRKNRTISRQEFSSMLETPPSQDFKDSFLGQSLFDLSIGLRSLDSVLKQILNFRLNAPLKYYSYSSLLELINASALCPPDAVLQLLTIGKVMITKHNYAKPKYLRALIKVTKYLIHKDFYYVSYGEKMQDKPKRKLQRLLRIFTDYLDIPPIGFEGEYQTSKIEDMMNVNKSFNDERLEKDIQRRKRNKKMREDELKNNNKFLSESDDSENEHTEVNDSFSFESDIFSFQKDKIINSHNVLDNENAKENQEGNDDKIHNQEKDKNNTDAIVGNEDQYNLTQNKYDILSPTKVNNDGPNYKFNIDYNKDSLKQNDDSYLLTRKENIPTLIESETTQNSIQERNDNLIDKMDQINENENDADKSLPHEKNDNLFDGNDINIGKENLPRDDNIDKAIEKDHEEEKVEKENEDIIEIENQDIIPEDKKENITDENNNKTEKDSETNVLERDDDILSIGSNIDDNAKDDAGENNLSENDNDNLLMESDNGNSNTDDLANLLIESDNGNSNTDDLANLLVDSDNDKNSTDQILDRLLNDGENENGISDNIKDDLLNDNENNSSTEQKNPNENYVDTKSQTENFDRKSQLENYVDEKSQTENDNDVYDDNFPIFKNLNINDNSNEMKSNFEEYDQMSSRSWKSSLTESVQFTIDIEPENTNQNGEENIQLRQLEDSDPNIQSIERFIRSTDTIYERREKGIQRLENLNPEQRAQISSLAKLFNNWKTAYASSRVVWNTMKADSKFDVNILLSQIPVSYGDFLIEALTTFAEQEGILIQKIESPM